MREIPSIARALILMLAFAWPFGAIVYIPVLDVTLLPAAGAVVVVLALIDAIQHRDHRPPFELVWPVTVAIVLVWFDPQIEHPLQYSIGLGLFVAVVQFARGERFVTSCLRTTATAGTILVGLAAVNFFISAINALPYQSFLYFAPPGIVVAPMIASSEAFWEYALTLIVCLFVVFAGWLGEPRVPRTVAVPVIGAFVVPLFVVALGIGAKHWWITLPELHAPGVIHAAFLLILLWLAARTTARIAVSRRERERGVRTGVFFVSVAFVGLLLLAEQLSFPEILIVLALLAGRGDNSHIPEYRTLPATICILPAIALLGLNLLRVYPANADDPRNYEVQLRKDVQANRLDRAWKRLSLVRSWHEERRTRLWSARLALEFGFPYESAEDFRLGLHVFRKGWPVLPPPSESELDAYLVRLRDYCSTVPNPDQEYAYELALIAAGKEASALALLTQKARVLRDNAGMPDRELPLLLIMSTVLGCDQHLIENSSLRPDRIWNLLKNWGLHIEPNSLPNQKLPVVAAIRFGTNLGTCTVVDLDRMKAGIPNVFWLTHDARPAPLATNGIHSGPTWWEIVRAPDGAVDARLHRDKPNSVDQSSEYVAAWKALGFDFAIYVQGGFDQPLPDKPAILMLLP